VRRYSAARLKTKVIHMKRILLGLISLAVTFPLLAQRGSAPPTGVSPAMAKMFGEIKTFTAQAESRVLDKEQKEVAAIPMTLALRDGKLRAEMDLTQVKGGAVPPDAVAMLKQAGLDKMVTLVDSAKKSGLMIYPGAQACAELPNAQEELSSTEESSEVGKEMLGAHTCKKIKIVVTDSKGRKSETFVWQAADLKNFPIQIETHQKSTTTVVKFQDPKFEAPAAAQFEVPANYTHYANFQELMQAAMMKMFSGAAGAK
jgi:hypothetical protein